MTYYDVTESIRKSVLGMSVVFVVSRGDTNLKITLGLTVVNFRRSEIP